MILTSESVDEIIWCDHSSETSSAVLSHGTMVLFYFYEIWGFVLNFDFRSGVKRLTNHNRLQVHVPFSL